MPPAEGERGIALLTVLMLVAVISVLAATALEKLRITTRLAGNAISGEQARGFAYAAETMALVRIGGLLEGNRDRVTLAGGWSGRPFALPVAGGIATARVTDGGNCFNLNGLVTEEGPGTYVSYAVQRDRFARLMRLLGIDARAAEQVAAGASDWIDTDQQPLPNGAEDSAYLGQTTRYRTAGTLMADPSELRAVAGVTPDLYARLRPWVCTLPAAGANAINVNTLLPEQAPLLAMLQETLGVEAARQALLRRPVQGYANPAEIWRAAGAASDGEGAGVTSRWFALRIDVAAGGTTIVERATIDATRLPVQLVSRQWGEDT